MCTRYPRSLHSAATLFFVMNSVISFFCRPHAKMVFPSQNKQEEKTDENAILLTFSELGKTFSIGNPPVHPLTRISEPY